MWDLSTLAHFYTHNMVMHQEQVAIFQLLRLLQLHQWAPCPHRKERNRVLGVRTYSASSEAIH